jgi:xanthine dehydrogenase accessory factor
LVDPGGDSVRYLQPAVVVDAIMAKRNICTKITDAPVVIALGPGFHTGRDCHAVIETKRGHFLGKVILEGAALPDTGQPAPVNGYSHERLIRAPAGGIFTACRQIGEKVDSQDLVGLVGEHPVRASMGGILRGLIRTGCRVEKGLKIGDIDPRLEPGYCHTISDKARAVAGGVLEAMLYLLKKRENTKQA